MKITFIHKRSRTWYFILILVDLMVTSDNSYTKTFSNQYTATELNILWIRERKMLGDSCV